MKQINVAISIHLPNDPGSSIWSNGAVQHAIFLCMLLEKLPYVKQVWLGTYQPPNMQKWDLGAYSSKVVQMSTIIADVDLLIEMVQSVPASDVAAVRKAGGRFVAYRVGHSYARAVESALFGVSENWEVNPNNLVADAVWMNAQYVATCKSLFEIAYNAKAISLPHLWSPFFLRDGMHWNPKSALGWPYGGNGDKVQISIFEPNISVVKNCLIPFLIASEFYEKNRDKVKNIFLYNALHLKKNRILKHFVLGSAAGKDRIASVEARYSIVDALGQQGGVVVSHQWENGLNYLYYEALYGGFPLVHNSPFLRDIGYYYDGFNIKEGVEALSRAVYLHNVKSEEYTAAANRFLRSVDPNEHEVLSAYDSEIRRLFSIEAFGSNIDR